MKSKEEIERLGKQSAQKKYRLQHIPLEQIDEYGGEIKDYVTIFIQGYTQCQEDMADKKYNLDDMKKACACGIDIVCKEGPNDFQPFADLINSLNKGD